MYWAHVVVLIVLVPLGRLVYAVVDMAFHFEGPNDTKTWRLIVYIVPQATVHAGMLWGFPAAALGFATSCFLIAVTVYVWATLYMKRICGRGFQVAVEVEDHE